MSGLNQRFTKPSFLNRNREFESHRLRIDYLVSDDASALFFNAFLVPFFLKIRRPGEIRTNNFIVQ